LQAEALNLKTAAKSAADEAARTGSGDAGALAQSLGELGKSLERTASTVAQGAAQTGATGQTAAARAAADASAAADAEKAAEAARKAEEEARARSEAEAEAARRKAAEEELARGQGTDGSGQRPRQGWPFRYNHW